MKTLIKNKKASFNYEILDKYTAGIVLVGTEIKSIIEAKASINEAYCFISNNEVFIKGMTVSQHQQTSQNFNHEPNRDRKLLLNKKEIIKLRDSVAQKGLTIIPLEVKRSEGGLIKIEIGLCRGKNTLNKKETIKLRDLDREENRNK